MEESWEEMSDILVISLDLPKTPATSISGRIRLVSKFLTNDRCLNLSYVRDKKWSEHQDFIRDPSPICKLNIMGVQTLLTRLMRRMLAIVSPSDLPDVKREVRRQVLRIIRDGRHGVECTGMQLGKTLNGTSGENPDCKAPWAAAKGKVGRLIT